MKGIPGWFPGKMARADFLLCGHLSTPSLSSSFLLGVSLFLFVPVREDRQVPFSVRLREGGSGNGARHAPPNHARRLKAPEEKIAAKGHILTETRTPKHHEGEFRGGVATRRPDRLGPPNAAHVSPVSIAGPTEGRHTGRNQCRNDVLHQVPPINVNQSPSSSVSTPNSLAFPPFDPAPVPTIT